MQFDSSLLALVGILTSTALGADVYSSFTDANGGQIGSVTFNVGNDGCFQVPEAAQVGFSQSGSANTATGPYCLTGYPQGSYCDAEGTTQQFENVNLVGGVTYALEQGLNNVGSYKWNTGSC